MAITTPTELLSTGSGTAAASYVTASVSPAANTPLVLWVSSALTTGADGPTSVTGLGLTWTKVIDQDSNNANLNGSLFTTKTGASPGSGALTITFAAARGNCGWKLLQGNGGDVFVTASAASASNASTTPSVVLATAPASTSAVFAFLGYNAGSANTMTPTAPLVKIGADADTPGSPANQLSAAWDDPASPSQTVAYTTTNSSNKVIAGIALTEATGGTNTAPTANAGPDQSVTTAAAVTLTGAASTDPDGTIASYAWTQTAGTAVTLSGTGATRTFTAPGTAQTLTFSLVVTDNAGAASAADAVNVVVAAAATALMFPTVTLVSGATSTGGTGQVALADTDELTYVELAGGGIVDLTLPRIAAPAADLVVTLRDSSATASSLTVTLRDGTTAVATATASPTAPGTAAGDRTFTFAAASISSVTAAKWDAGTLKFRCVMA